jgi:hypothetical protein
MTTDLKPCRCGSDDIEGSYTTNIRCHYCGAIGPTFLDGCTWNTRAEKATEQPKEAAHATAGESPAAPGPTPGVVDLRDPEIYRRALDVALLGKGDDDDAIDPEVFCNTVDAIAAERERRGREPKDVK